MSGPPRYHELSESAKRAVNDIVELYAERVTCNVELVIVDGGNRSFYVRGPMDMWLKTRDRRS